jgi:hypothetical protein
MLCGRSSERIDHGAIYSWHVQSDEVNVGISQSVDEGGGPVDAAELRNHERGVVATSARKRLLEMSPMMLRFVFGEFTDKLVAGPQEPLDSRALQGYRSVPV